MVGLTEKELKSEPVSIKYLSLEMTYIYNVPNPRWFILNFIDLSCVSTLSFKSFISRLNLRA